MARAAHALQPLHRVLRWVASGLVLPGFFAACGPSASLPRARQLVSGNGGELVRGCEMAGDLLDEAQGRGERLATVRLWIDCLRRAGRLDRAERRLGERAVDGATLYGRALLALARTPAALPRAVKLFAAAGERWPDQGEIPYRLGVVLLADEQPERALPHLRRACKLEPMAACEVALSHALLDGGDVDRALAHVHRMVELQPRPPDLKRGRALIRRLARRRRRVPQSVAAPYRQAMAQLSTHDRPALALSQAKALVADHADVGALYTLLGLAHLRLGNTADGVVALREAIHRDPEDPQPHLYLAVIYQSQGRLEDSAERYRVVLRLDPLQPRAVIGLGEVLRQLKRHREAASVLDRLVALEQGSHRSLRLAARAHLAAGQLEASRRHLVRLLEREPGDYEAHLRLGQILAQLARDDPGRRAELLSQARRHADAARAKRPGDPEVEALQHRLASAP